ncbi:hypothetical protein [Sphingomonas faeni]|uniref:hypothetical protein n=1 Tax=Sphingomonas faeni TaxID=185950 RepID=UPI00335C0EEA
MATQFKHTGFAYTPAPAPRPNIRVAFIAGEATTAVHNAMAKLPADTRDSTLEDLVWDQGVAASSDVELIQSIACSLIDTARNLLSPAMYTAFLRWGETASHACAFYTSDDDGEERCAATAEALSLVSDVDAENVHDLLFTMLLACIETIDAPSFGPFDRKYGEFDVNGGDLLAGLSRDLRNFSPIPDMVNELSARAWDVSKSRLALSIEIGHAITSAFSFARGEDDAGPSELVMDGYDRFMRGPLIQWRRAYDSYREIKAQAEGYYKDVVLPADARFRAVRDKWPSSYDFTNDAAAQAECNEVDYTDIEGHCDGLWDQLHDAKVRLYLIPAPSAAELAIKLKLFSENRDSDLTRSREVIEQMMFDARRFGRHGAHLQTDQALLAAFTTRRHEFEAADKGPWTAEQEDAYFSRVDAAETVLLDTRATTLEGAIAKLRVAFMNQDGSDWSDLAISNTADPKFIEGLRMSGMYERMAWGAIEDLARIAGVSLAEQGA